MAAAFEDPTQDAPRSGAPATEDRRRVAAGERRAHFWKAAARVAERERSRLAPVEDAAGSAPRPGPTGRVRTSGWRRLALALARVR